MTLRRILGGLLLTAWALAGSGCVDGRVDPPAAGGAVLVVEGNVLDRLTGRGARRTEVRLTAHVGGTRFTGRANTMPGGHFIIRVTGPAGARAGELNAVDIVVRGRGYRELAQALPAHLIHQDGPVLVLPDVQIDRTMPW